MSEVYNMYIIFYYILIIIDLYSDNRLIKAV